MEVSRSRSISERSRSRSFSEESQCRSGTSTLVINLINHVLVHVRKDKASVIIRKGHALTHLFLGRMQKFIPLTSLLIDPLKMAEEMACRRFTDKSLIREHQLMDIGRLRTIQQTRLSKLPFASCLQPSITSPRSDRRT